MSFKDFSAAHKSPDKEKSAAESKPAVPAAAQPASSGKAASDVKKATP